MTNETKNYVECTVKLLMLLISIINLSVCYIIAYTNFSKFETICMLLVIALVYVDSMLSMYKKLIVNGSQCHREYVECLRGSVLHSAYTLISLFIIIMIRSIL